MCAVCSCPVYGTAGLTRQMHGRAFPSLTSCTAAAQLPAISSSSFRACPGRSSSWHQKRCAAITSAMQVITEQMRQCGACMQVSGEPPAERPATRALSPAQTPAARWRCCSRPSAAGAFGPGPAVAGAACHPWPWPAPRLAASAMATHAQRCSDTAHSCGQHSSRLLLAIVLSLLPAGSRVSGVLGRAWTVEQPSQLQLHTSNRPCVSAQLICGK